MENLDYYKRMASQYYRQVGAIDCVERLNSMGLEPRSIIGTFWLRDIEKLIEVCNGEPSLHIITSIGAGHKVNKFIEGPYKYRLAEGDNDPKLELRLPPEVVNHIFAELNQLVRRYGFGF